MKQKILNVAKKFNATKATVGAWVVANVMYNPVFAKAAGGGGLLGNPDATAADGASIIETAINGIMNIFPWIGAFFIVSGVFKLVMVLQGRI